MPEIYPSDYPQPTWEYQQEMTAYQERSQMECGWTRQRRTWNAQGSAVSMEFIMDTATFETWVDWVNLYGYEYFTIDLDKIGGVRQPQNVRFVSPLQFRYQNFDKIVVTVSGEYQLNLLPTP